MYDSNLVAIGICMEKKWTLFEDFNYTNLHQMTIDLIDIQTAERSYVPCICLESFFDPIFFLN